MCSSLSIFFVCIVLGFGFSASPSYATSAQAAALGFGVVDSENVTSVSDLVIPYGYPLEIHYVTTEDGYILSLLRIPHGVSRPGHISSAAESVQHRRLLTNPRSQKPCTSQAHGAVTKGCMQHGGTDVGSSSERGKHGSRGGSRRGDSNNSTTRTARRPVVLLQHGLLDSAAGFLLMGPNASLAFILADAGFDVWLANARGSTLSRAHTSLPITTSDYWAFSWDEMARYDLPAEVAHITATTGADSLAYVGHSQGTTVLLAALASLPDLARRIHYGVLLAPVAFASHMTSIPMRTLAALGTDTVFTLLGWHEFLPSQRVVSYLEGQLCAVQPAMCMNLLSAICGYRRGAIDQACLPLYLRFTPAGTSVQNMAHWAQAVRHTGPSTMSFFDYGTTCGDSSVRQRTCNQLQYNGSTVPPVYRMEAIPSHVRLALFTGGADRLSDALDVEYLREALPPGVVDYVQHDPDLEHLDYIWATDAPGRLYAKVLTLLRAATPGGGGAQEQ